MKACTRWVIKELCGAFRIIDEETRTSLRGSKSGRGFDRVSIFVNLPTDRVDILALVGPIEADTLGLIDKEKDKMEAWSSTFCGRGIIGPAIVAQVSHLNRDRRLRRVAVQKWGGVAHHARFPHSCCPVTEAVIL
jgi:hypothetical protein